VVVKGVTRKNMRFYCTGVHRLHTPVFLVKVLRIQGKDLRGEEGEVLGSKLIEYTAEKRS
jgi:hypothetical protein